MKINPCLATGGKAMQAVFADKVRGPHTLYCAAESDSDKEKDGLNKSVRYPCMLLATWGKMTSVFISLRKRCNVAIFQNICAGKMLSFKVCSNSFYANMY